MSDDGRAGRRSRRHDLGRSLAPHVDPRWTEAVVLELRILGVAGDRIGAALAEVDAHCVDSDEPAVDAFGDPVAYARSLALPAGAGASRGALALAALPPAIQVVGMLVVLAAVPALRRGDPAELTTGHLGMLAVLAAVVGAVVVRSDGALRLVVERPVVAWLVGVVALGTGSALLVLGDAVLLRVPPAAALLLGVTAMAAGAGWGLARWRDDADPLVAPTGGAVPVRGGRAARHVTAWQVPAATVVLAGLLWWLTP